MTGSFATAGWAADADKHPATAQNDEALEETHVPAPAPAEPPKPFGNIPTGDDGYTKANKIDLFMGADPIREAARTNPAQADVLTLEEACKLAVLQHPRIDSALADYEEAIADLGLARTVYFPRVDWQTKVGPSKDLQTGDTEQGDSAITVTQKLYQFGGIRDSVESAELSFEGAQKQHLRVQEEIAALAINAYLALLQAEELKRVQEGSLDFYKKLLNSFQERYIAGISSKADAKKVEVSLRDTQAQLIQQNEQLTTTRNLLENIIYQPVNAVEHNVDVLRVNLPDTIEEAYARAMESNTNIQALKLQIAAKRKSVEAARADYYPSLGYRMQLKNEFQKMDKIDNFTQTFDAQLTVGWTLFEGFSTRHKINKQKAGLRRLVATQKGIELEIKNVLTDAINAYEASAAEHELAKDAFDSSVNLMSLYLSEFDLGIRTLLDLITAREGQTSAAIREVNARFARIRAAVNILLEEGRLGKTLNLSPQE